MGDITPRLCVRGLSFRNLREPNFSAFPLFLASLARFYWLSPHGRRLASPLVRFVLAPLKDFNLKAHHEETDGIPAKTYPLRFPHVIDKYFLQSATL